MIKLKQIRTANSETVLTFQYDSNDKAQVLTTDVNKQVIDAKLANVSNILGRDPTRQDWVDAVKSIINDARLNIQQVPQPVNPVDIIDQDLEAS